MAESPRPKIFITHSWRDIDFARRLYDDLKAQGFEVWFDDKTLQAGHRMAEEINRGLAWCDVYIPVISRASLASKWCDEEINAAISLSVESGNAKPRIISALVEDCRDELKKRYPSLVARLYIDFTGRYDEALQELLEKGLGRDLSAEGRAGQERIEVEPTAPTPDPDIVQIGSNDPIQIAYIFVTSGENATLGLDTKYGVELAIDDKGGKLLGHTIKLSGQDGGCNAEGGHTAATTIVTDKTVVAVIGTNCASEARTAMPILSRFGLSMISPSNTAPDLTDPATHIPGYFRVSHNDKLQSIVAAEFAFKQLKLSKVATIHDGSIYASSLTAAFAERFKLLGGTITAQETVQVGQRDMRPVLTRITTGKPDLIYFPIFVAEGGFICSQMRDVPGLERTVMMGADGIFSPDFVKSCGKNVVGMFLSCPDFSTFGSDYPVLVAKYIRKYNTKGVLAPFRAHAYDAANIIFAAIEKVAVKDADGTLHIPKRALRDAIAATRNFKGVTGNLTCGSNGDCADPKISIYRISADNFAKLTLPSRPVWFPGGLDYKP